MNQLLQKVRAAGQDFEWYPTTRAMLALVAEDIKKEFGRGGRQSYNGTVSILDVGAGNGNALAVLDELTGGSIEKYAIEKSKILIDAMPPEIYIVGTDFYEQTFIDKKVDVIFCNPPYSDFSGWMRRIVAEANARVVYMVVPQRWKEDTEIMELLHKRCKIQDEETPVKQRRPDDQDTKGLFEILGIMSFEDSEYRTARAHVDVLKIRFPVFSHYRAHLQEDPFDLWFDSTFKLQAPAERAAPHGERMSQRERLHDLVAGANLIERLEELYRVAKDKLLMTYKALENVDPDLLKELAVDMNDVKKGLKQKIEGLKNLYWQELFANLSAITDRLTSASRKQMLEKLTAHTSVDFTGTNAYAVVVWAVKNANLYFDRQLLEVYLKIANKESIKNYKSNTRLVEDGFRYSYYDAPRFSHYTLDYRLVIAKAGRLEDGRWGNGLSDDGHDFLNDLCAIARNLGFEPVTDSRKLHWSAGDKKEFLFADGTLMMDVRMFKNDNCHIRVNQELMKKVNVEAGRLNGWVKSPAEAAEETGIEDAAECFGANFTFKSVNSLPLLEAFSASAPRMLQIEEPDEPVTETASQEPEETQKDREAQLGLVFA